MIIKEGHGSFGMKVYLIETEEQFYEKTDELRGIDYVFQEFIANSRGRDIRVNIVGGEIVRQCTVTLKLISGRILRMAVLRQ